MYMFGQITSGLLVTALQSHLQQRFISLPDALSLPQQLSRKFTFVSFKGDNKLSVPGTPLN